MFFITKDVVKRLNWKIEVGSDDLLFPFHLRNSVKSTYCFYTYAYLFQKLVGWTHILFVNIGIWIRWSMWGYSVYISPFSPLRKCSLVDPSLFLAFILPHTVEGHFWLTDHNVYSRKYIFVIRKRDSDLNFLLIFIFYA